MIYDIFTHGFRKKLKFLVRTASGPEARILAVKISPIFSLLLGAIILLYVENYSYLTLVVVFLAATLLGAMLTYRHPKWILWLMRPLTLEENDQVWARNKKEKRRNARNDA